MVPICVYLYLEKLLERSVFPPIGAARCRRKAVGSALTNCPPRTLLGCAGLQLIRPADGAEHSRVFAVLQLAFARPAAFPGAGHNKLHCHFAEHLGQPRSGRAGAPWFWMRCGSSHDPEYCPRIANCIKLCEVSFALGAESGRWAGRVSGRTWDGSGRCCTSTRCPPCADPVSDQELAASRSGLR